MSLANLMMGYSHSILTKEMGNSFEKRIRDEIKYGKKEIKEEKQGKMRLHIFKVDAAPLYDLYITLNEGVDESNNESYAVKNISEVEMEDLINQFKKLK